MDHLLNMETLTALRKFDEPGKNDFIAEIVDAYLADTAYRFKSLWETHKTGDAGALGKVAHSVKGSSLNVGADGLAALMKTIEMDEKAGTLSAVEKIAEAEKLFVQVSEALTKFRNS